MLERCWMLDWSGHDVDVLYLSGGKVQSPMRRYHLSEALPLTSSPLILLRI